MIVSCNGQLCNKRIVHERCRYGQGKPRSALKEFYKQIDAKQRGIRIKSYWTSLVPDCEFNLKMSYYYCANVSYNVYYTIKITTVMNVIQYKSLTRLINKSQKDS